MKRKTTNPELITTIRELKKKSKISEARLWNALAEELDKAKRNRLAVNLSLLNRNTSNEQIVAVPGKVLGAGNLNHSLTVAAFSFSSAAREKISIAGGKCLNIKELIDSGISPSDIRIMK